MLGDAATRALTIFAVLLTPLIRNVNTFLRVSWYLLLFGQDSVSPCMFQQDCCLFSRQRTSLSVIQPDSSSSCLFRVEKYGKQL